MTAPRVVLSRPQNGENVGLAVRLCANFAIDDLVLVTPAPGWRGAAERPASMCRDRLARVRVADTLPEAIADCTHVLGLTARHGRERRALPLQELGDDLQSAGKARTALVFGNEEHGLNASETALCTRLYRTALPGLTSLNLSHAVALVLWECARSNVAQPPDPDRPMLNASERERIATRAFDVLGAAGFRTEDPHFEGALGRLVRSAQLQARDGRMLLRILRHIEWLVDRSSDPPSD